MMVGLDDGGGCQPGTRREDVPSKSSAMGRARNTWVKVASPPK